MGKGFILTPGLSPSPREREPRNAPQVCYGQYGCCSSCHQCHPTLRGTVPVTTRSQWGPFRTLQLLLWWVLPCWRRCYGKEERKDCGTGSKSGGGDGFQASDAVTLSEPEAAEEDEGSAEGKGAAVKAKESGAACRWRSHRLRASPAGWHSSPSSVCLPLVPALLGHHSQG